MAAASPVGSTNTSSKPWKLAFGPSLTKSGYEFCSPSTPLGTIKHAMNRGYFLLRGSEKVRPEMGLMVLAYNIKRAIRILGVPRMIQALA